jgi:hypothetical protein
MNEFEPTGTEVTIPEGPEGRSRVPHWLRKKRNQWIASSALVVAILGTSVGVATSSSTPAPAPTASASSSAAGSSTAASATGSSTAVGHGFPGGGGSAGGGSPARTTSAQGGTTGTVGTTSGSGFTMTTPAGQKVTINESSSTAYENGSTTTTSSAVKSGDYVLVLGTVDSTTIAASEVSVQTPPATEPATAATVIPFTRGKTSASTKVGTIPANWSEGQGTLVSGSAANEATEAALAAYPGGVVDRAVVLSDGDYNVHFIGVNWPHHVFLNSSFTVIGAE